MAGREPLRTRDEQIGAAFAVHAERLHRMVASRVVEENRHLADDACGVAWSKLLRRDDVEIDPDERYVGWLYAVARNEMSDLVRRERQTLSLDTWGREDGGDGDAPVDRLIAPEEPARLAEQREEIALLDELPPAQRQALLMHAAGHTYAEIGDLTGQSDRQVCRNMVKARRAVRDLRRERSVGREQQNIPEFGGTQLPRAALVRDTTHDMELDLDL